MFLLSRLNQGLDLGRFLLRQLRREILKSWHLSSIGIYPSMILVLAVMERGF